MGQVIEKAIGCIGSVFRHTLCVVPLLTIITDTIMAVLQGIVFIFSYILSLFSCVITYVMAFFGFFYDKIMIGWRYIHDFTVTSIKTLKGTSKVVKRVLDAIHRSFTTKSPWWVRLIAYYMRKVMDIFLLTLQFLGNSISYIIMLFVMGILWYFIFYPYVLYIEDNPAIVGTIIDQYSIMISSIVNFFIDIYNGFRGFYNHILPLVWMTEIEIYKYGYLIVEFVKSLIGAPNGFGYTGQDSVRDDTRNLADNPVFSDSATTTSSAGEEVWIFVVRVISSLVEVLFTVIFILVEHVLKRIVTLKNAALQLVRLFDNLSCGSASDSAGACLFLEFLIVAMEILLIPLNAILHTFGQQPLRIPGCTDGSLVGVDCTCSAKEGGVFSGQSACPIPEYTCYDAVDVDGNMMWSETEVCTGSTSCNSQQPRRESTDKTIGCPHTYGQVTPTTGARLLTGIITDRRSLMKFYPTTLKCKNSCIKSAKLDYGWKFEICGSQKTYIGKCTEEKSRRNLPGEFLGVDVAQNDLNAYIKWSNDKKVSSIRVPSIKKEEKPKPISKDVFQQIVLYVEKLKVDNSDLGLECNHASYTSYIPDSINFFPSILFDGVCIMKKMLSVTPATETFKRNLNTEEDPDDLMKIFTPWDRETDISWDPDGHPVDRQIQPTERSISDIYMEPITIFYSNFDNPDKPFIQKLDEFHESLINTHSEFIGKKRPEKGIFTSIMVNITKHFTARKQKEVTDLKLAVEERHQITNIAKKPIEGRRKLNHLTTYCPEGAYPCPNGECDLTGTGNNCKSCSFNSPTQTSSTTRCFLQMIPYTVI